MPRFLTNRSLQVRVILQLFTHLQQCIYLQRGGGNCCRQNIRPTSLSPHVLVRAWVKFLSRLSASIQEQ